MKYTAKFIQIDVCTKERDLVFEDENGNQEVSDEKCGFLFRKGEQLFDINGKELTLPEGIKKVEKYIGRDNDEHYEYFYATKENDAKTILEYEFKRNFKSSPTREFRFIGGYKNPEIIDMNLKGTLFEEWVKYPTFSERKTKLEDWVIIKVGSFIKNYDFLYVFFNIKSRSRLIHYEYKDDKDLLFDMSWRERISGCFCDFFIALPTFATTKNGVKCMVMSDYVTSENLLGYGWEELFMGKDLSTLIKNGP